jgi:uncharacterized protein (DUF2236 family)
MVKPRAQIRPTTLADVAAEGILLAGGGRAILLQIAHPAIGHGVARHSDFAHAPMDRLRGTLRYVYALSHGTEEQVTEMRRTVNRAHAAVHDETATPPYNAMDGELQLWVAATLYDTAILIYERVFGTLDEVSAEQIYRGYAALGTTLQMRQALWPPDRAAFAVYWEKMLETLAVDEESLVVSESVLRPRHGPVYLRIGMPSVRTATIALLPHSLRKSFQLEWSSDEQRRFDSRAARFIAIYRRLPVAIRHWPMRHYLTSIGKAAQQQA